MSNITLNRKEFEKQIKLTNEVIEKISLFGTPVESIDHEKIEIEIFPNRPDLLSMQGFLRGFKAFIGKETGLKKYKLQKPEKNYAVKIDSSVKSIRPFTACAVVKNLKFDDEKIKEIIDLQEKLHFTVGRNRKKLAIGVYPLEKIVLPIKFEARAPEKIIFTPLEAEKEMSGLQILNKHPAGKEYAHLLEGMEKFPVFVDARDKILSMPPIINSNETGRVTGETKDVFIECSGLDLEVLQKTLNIIVTVLAEMGGRIYQMTLNYPDKKVITPNLSSDKMKVSLENTNKLLGLSLKEADLQKLLPKMGYDYKNKTVSIPAWRTDILHEVDIIEDIAIAYGYDKIIAQVPNISTAGEESLKSKVKSKISEVLIGLGLTEISTYHLIKQNEAELMKIQDKIELEDSKTDYKLLRPNLLTPALRILAENKDNEYPQEVFEIGTVFARDNSEKEQTCITESENLLIACSPANFTRIKQILNYLTRSLNIACKIEEFAHKNLIDGRTTKIKLDEKNIGYLGEIHPETLREWGIKMPVVVLEISLKEILTKLNS